MRHVARIGILGLGLGTRELVPFAKIKSGRSGGLPSAAGAIPRSSERSATASASS